MLSSIAIANGTPLDIFADFSFEATSTVTTAAPNFLGLYVYPLLDNGTAYGDGRFGSAAAGPPPGGYWAGNMGFVAAASTTIVGAVSKIILPPGSFKFVLYNGAGVALPASGLTAKYRTYNRAIA